MREANPKPWQVQHEINIEISVTFFVKFAPILCCLNFPLKLFSRCLFDALQLKEETLGFPEIYHNNKSNEK